MDDAGRVPVVERIAHLDQGAKDGCPTVPGTTTQSGLILGEITAPIFSIGTLNAQGKTNQAWLASVSTSANQSKQNLVGVVLAAGVI